nr:T9SS type A sorting domain-containing protein [Bacteroidota bacterium]
MGNYRLFLMAFTLQFGITTFAQHGWVKQDPMVVQNLQAVDFFNEQAGVAVGDNGTIISTENGGEAWLVVSGITPDLKGVAFASEFRVFAVGTGGSVFLSENQGQSWVQITGPGVGYNLLDISFDKASGHGVITGQTNAIIVTSDFGETWTIVEDGYMSTFYTTYMANNQMGVVMGWNSIFQPLLGYTLDWQNWDYCNFYPTWGGVMYEGKANGGKFLDEVSGFIVGTYFVPGGGFLAPFGGWNSNSWESQSFPQPLNAIDLKETFGVVAGNNGYLAESEDGGESWEMVSINADNNMLNDVLLVANTGYIVGNMGMLFKMQSSVTISEHSLNSDDARCYPNPCYNYLTVDLGDREGPINVFVFDLIGNIKICRRIAGSVGKLVLNINELEAGFYFVKIDDLKGSTVLKFTRKIE